MSALANPFRWLGLLWNKSAASSGGFLVAVVIAWGFEFVYAMAATSSPMKGIASFCLLWFTSGAAFFVGTLSGILFGLPRAQLSSLPDTSSNTGSTHANNTGQTHAKRYRANTNLEDVSDWLTKIIVGLGLAQFPKVIDFFDSIAVFVGDSLGTGNSGRVIVLSSVVYGLVCGFLYYYVWARLVLQRNLELP